jgi:hypothetical protein
VLVLRGYASGTAQDVRKLQVLEDISAYTEPRPTFQLGFTLKSGATIEVMSYSKRFGESQGYYCVRLLSGYATYHCSGQPTKRVDPWTPLIPPMYVDAGVFHKGLMDLVW